MVDMHNVSFNYNYQASRYLREAETQDYSADAEYKCQKEIKICVENLEKGTNTCHGDSGIGTRLSELALLW